MKRSLGAKTLTYPNPVWLVGSYDTNGRANLITVAWGGICCSQPPCISVSLRTARHSFASIMARRAFTVCIPSERHMMEADYAGIVSGRDQDKFAIAGLTPVRSDLVDAPYVQEFPIALECRLLHTLDLGLHTQFIGEIIDVKADEQVLGSNGLPDIHLVQPLLFDFGDKGYYAVGERRGTAFSVGKELQNRNSVG